MTSILSFRLKTVIDCFLYGSQFTRDNFDLWSNTKNAQLMLGIFYYLFENNYDCPCGQVMSCDWLRQVMMPYRAV